ncbi:MAG: S-layer homology domain-containing protein [Clostridiales bacterium]|nr:S-layer homology domain-containing protein [Clostridiales bacterium]
MRKFILILIVLALSFPLCAGAAESFSDVHESDWYFDFAQDAKNLGILSGYPDGSFRPARTLSYGEFLAMVLMGDSSENTAGSSHWAAGFYSRGLELGYFSEADIAIRMLDEPIPRCDMAIVLAGVIASKELASQEGSNGEASAVPESAHKIYSDIDAADPYEYAVAVCSERGVLSGYPDGSFKPYGFLSRAEAAAAMIKLAESIGLKEPQQENGDTSVQSELPSPEQDVGLPRREEIIAVYEQTGERYVNYKDPDAARLLSPVAKAYIDKIFKSAVFSKSGGNYTASFSRLDFPENCSGKIGVLIMKPNGSYMKNKDWTFGEKCEVFINYDKSMELAGKTLVDLGKDMSAAYSVSLAVNMWNRKTKESASCRQIYYIEESRGETRISVDCDAFRASSTASGFDFKYDW